jgi:hypothetical protein
MTDKQEDAHVFRVTIVVVCDDHKAEQFEALLEEHLSEMKNKIMKKLGMETTESDD